MLTGFGGQFSAKPERAAPDVNRLKLLPLE
jgi:hypothetical protein